MAVAAKDKFRGNTNILLGHLTVDPKYQPISILGRAKRYDLAYLSSTVEAHEGLATMSVIDGKNGLVQFCFFCHLAQNAIGLIFALQDEIGMELFMPGSTQPFPTTKDDSPVSHVAAV